jgi:two-component system sensor histidine kinase UhpB
VGLEEAGERREAMMQTLRKGLQETAEGVRRIARGLRPPELEDAGVVAALQAHIRNVFENQTMRTSFDAGPVDQFLSDHGKLVLYRVVQEALSNVVRHSAATTVNVAIQTKGSTVVAVVEDDGVGFDQSGGVGDRAGLGLLGMRERAASAGGSVQVDSQQGRGTQVRLSIPQQHGDGLDG